MKNFLLILLLLSAVATHAQQMTVHEKNNGSSSYGLSDINKITFDATNQNIQLKSSSASIKISEIRKITFSFGVSANANLATLTTSQGTLTPVFAAGTTA